MSPRLSATSWPPATSSSTAMMGSGRCCSNARIWCPTREPCRSTYACPCSASTPLWRGSNPVWRRVNSPTLRDEELPMSIRRHRHPLPMACAAFGCLLLTVCAGQTTTTNWTKSGADDQTIERELADCNAQANAALATEQGINADINATLGRNWQLGSTQGIEDQALRRQSVGVADRVLNDCMR